jgi:hypothetical protein
MLSAHVEWSRRLFALMPDGGVWGVPRSGLLFRKDGDTLVLIGSMPWEDGMPMTEDELTKQQDAEYADIQRHFEAAGVMVTRP